MRIDLTLKYLCLVKTRSVAKALCDDGRVLLDGNPARPSRIVAAGSRITIRYRARTVTVELTELPRKQLSKSAALDYYRRVETPRADSPQVPEGDDWREW